MNFRTVTLLVIIILIGIVLRVDSFKRSHPDIDEMYELSAICKVSFTDIFRRETFYGDHTSYPGEWVVTSGSLMVLGHSRRYVLSKFEELKRDKSLFSVRDRAIIYAPRIIFSLIGFFIFYKLCIVMGVGAIGSIVAMTFYATNFHLVYHDWSLRPYGLLPEFGMVMVLLILSRFRVLTAIFAFFLS